MDAADYSFGSVFDELRDEGVQTPEKREEYERSVRKMMAVRKMLLAIDGERERRGMSKNDLAELVGINPAAIRRLFTSERANPTLGTVLEILAALRIEVEFKMPSATSQSAQVEEAAPKARERSSRVGPGSTHSEEAA
jgi:ribosome-binding protein aMBF1 (putative translation factor)